jgi:hypothetical protein
LPVRFVRCESVRGRLPWHSETSSQRHWPQDELIVVGAQPVTFARTGPSHGVTWPWPATSSGSSGTTVTWSARPAPGALAEPWLASARVQLARPDPERVHGTCDVRYARRRHAEPPIQSDSGLRPNSGVVCDGPDRPLNCRGSR